MSTKKSTKTKKLIIRITEEEQQSIRRRCQEGGYKNGAHFVREMVFNPMFFNLINSPKHPKNSRRFIYLAYIDLVVEILKQMTGIGNNINQMAKALNTYRLTNQPLTEELLQKHISLLSQYLETNRKILNDLQNYQNYFNSSSR